MKIIDQKLGTFEIHHDGNNYSVVENTCKIDKKGNWIYKTHAYCSSVESALKRIIKLKVEAKQEVYDLKTYLKEFILNTKGIEVDFSI